MKRKARLFYLFSAILIFFLAASPVSSRAADINPIIDAALTRSDDNDGLTLHYQITDAANFASAFCSVYDTRNRFIKIIRLDTDADSMTAFIPCDPEQVGGVKIFAVSRDSVPIAPAYAISSPPSQWPVITLELSDKISSPRVTMSVDRKSRVDFTIEDCNSAAFSDLFNRPFWNNDPTGYIDSPAAYPDYANISSVLQAMATNLDDNDHGKGSVFDKYAAPDFKNQVAGYMSSEVPDGSVGRGFYLMNSPDESLTINLSEGLTSPMSAGKEYAVLFMGCDWFKFTRDLGVIKNRDMGPVTNPDNEEEILVFDTVEEAQTYADELNQDDVGTEFRVVVIEGEEEGSAGIIIHEFGVKIYNSAEEAVNALMELREEPYFNPGSHVTDSGELVRTDLQIINVGSNYEIHQIKIREAAHRDSYDSGYTFRAVYPVIPPDFPPDNPPETDAPRFSSVQSTLNMDVVDGSVSDTCSGRVSLIFNEYLYYSDNSASTPILRPVDRGPADAAERLYGDARNFISIESLIQSRSDSPDDPRINLMLSDSEIGRNTLAIDLVFQRAQNGEFIVFDANLCDRYGNIHSSPLIIRVNIQRVRTIVDVSPDAGDPIYGYIATPLIEISPEWDAKTA